MPNRRSCLAAVAGFGVAGLAGCGSNEMPDDEDELPGSASAAEDESASITFGFDELERWLPADACCPLLRSYESQVDDGELADDGRPTVDGVPALASVEFTDQYVDDAQEPPAMHVADGESDADLEGDGDAAVYETDSYTAVIEPALDAALLADTYEGAAERLVDANEDVGKAYEALDLAAESRTVVDHPADDASVAVSSTDGESGELAVVFEENPRDSEIDALREEVSTLGDIVATGDRLLVFEYAVPGS